MGTEPGERGDSIGRYQLGRHLGSGGSGSVYEALDPQSSRKVAIKLLNGAGESSERFEREAQALEALRHPNVVAIHEFGWEGQTPYLVLDLLEGESLEERISRGPLSPEEVAALGLTLARVLAFAHGHGVLHRDLKPANVFVRSDGEIVVIDFGLAKLEEAGALTKTGQFLGTPCFLSPELAAGHARRADERVDVYGVGAVLYAAATGEPPVNAGSWVETLVRVTSTPPQSIREQVQGFPRFLERVILRCLAKQPDDRYASCSELKQALLLRAEPRSRSTLLGLGAVATLFAAGGVAFALSATSPADDLGGASPGRSAETQEAPPSRAPASPALARFLEVIREGKVERAGRTFERVPRRDVADYAPELRAALNARLETSLSEEAGTLLALLLEVPDASFSPASREKLLRRLGVDEASLSCLQLLVRFDDPLPQEFLRAMVKRTSSSRRLSPPLRVAFLALLLRAGGPIAPEDLVGVVVEDAPDAESLALELMVQWVSPGAQLRSGPEQRAALARCAQASANARRHAAWFGLLACVPADRPALARATLEPNDPLHEVLANEGRLSSLLVGALAHTRCMRPPPRDRTLALADAFLLQLFPPWIEYLPPQRSQLWTKSRAREVEENAWLLARLPEGVVGTHALGSGTLEESEVLWRVLAKLGFAPSREQAIESYRSLNRESPPEDFVLHGYWGVPVLDDPEALAQLHKVEALQFWPQAPPALIRYGEACLILRDLLEEQNVPSAIARARVAAREPSVARILALGLFLHDDQGLLARHDPRSPLLSLAPRVERYPLRRALVLAELHSDLRGPRPEALVRACYERVGRASAGDLYATLDALCLALEGVRVDLRYSGEGVQSKLTERIADCVRNEIPGHDRRGMTNFDLPMSSSPPPRPGPPAAPVPLARRPAPIAAELRPSRLLLLRQLVWGMRCAGLEVRDPYLLSPAADEAGMILAGIPEGEAKALAAELEAIAYPLSGEE